MSSSPQAFTSRPPVGASYQDYGLIRETDLPAPPEAVGRSAEYPHSRFPVQMHYMLSDMEKDGQSAIAGWLPHGRAFVVFDKRRFETDVLPKQLNTYGFNRILTGRDKGAYYHELFLRGRRFLTLHIKRRKVGDAAKAPPISSTAVMDLYAYPPIVEQAASRLSVRSDVTPHSAVSSATGAHNAASANLPQLVLPTAAVLSPTASEDVLTLQRLLQSSLGTTVALSPPTPSQSSLLAGPLAVPAPSAQSPTLLQALWEQQQIRSQARSSSFPALLGTNLESSVSRPLAALSAPTLEDLRTSDLLLLRRQQQQQQQQQEREHLEHQLRDLKQQQQKGSGDGSHY